MFFAKEKIKRILDEMGSYFYPDQEVIASYLVKQGDFRGGEQPGLDTSDWEIFYDGEMWGGHAKHCWFRTEVVIPDRFKGKTAVYEVKTGRPRFGDTNDPAFLIYINGKLIQSIDTNHTSVVLAEEAKPGEAYQIALAAYSGMGDRQAALNTRLLVLDREVEKLYYHILAPLQLVQFLDPDDKKRVDIVMFLEKTINLLDLRKPFSDDFHDSVKNANRLIEEEFYNKYCGHDEVIAHCVGHAHIDVAWLWPLAQTREKAVRSFSTVLNLMRQYPEYVFMSSQPQLYQFVKEDCPEVYAGIKQKVREGRWEPEGAMWLEADCNLTSGESLVRQLLFGMRFFETEFGVKCRILWLPDVFGYSPALPQILKKSGIDYFMTTKMSWNEYNKIPYDTFLWQGLDGTEILTHFITTTSLGSKPFLPYVTNYNGYLDANNILGAWKRYQQKDLTNEILVSFGHGDGGGGPDKEMLELARRMAKGIPGCPRVEMGKALDFFEKLEKKVISNPKLPKWVGELYLELHRGTYTSMARNKKYNRDSEFLYQDAELFSSLMLMAMTGESYPQEKLNEGWRLILLNQFHDILPGSSIKEVYEDSKADYINIINNGKELLGAALEKISRNINLPRRAVIVFNQLSFMRDDLVELELPAGAGDFDIYDQNGKLLNSQLTKPRSEDQIHKLLFFAKGVPAKGYKVFYLAERSAHEPVPSADNQLEIGHDILNNPFLIIKLDENANISSIFDKSNGREVLQPGGKGNVLQAFEDKPITCDAWDINLFYQDKMWELSELQSIEVIETGPVRATLKIERRFLDSTVTQYLSVYQDIPRIDFDTRIDWKEKQILLKAAFPVDVHAEKATYEVQYGNVERPTHWNTSWDYAKFEVCAHKWADLSEDDFGVSLMNNCKYGHDIKDGVMRLTLLKSAVEPNVDADREKHQFTYSLYTHAGNWREAGTVQMAYSLNCPMYAVIEDAHTGILPPDFSLVASDRENVIIDAVKKTEDSDDIIIRAYECYNRRTAAEFTFGVELAAVWECDLMENNLEKMNFNRNSFKFIIKPYEIKTFKIRAKAGM